MVTNIRLSLNVALILLLLLSLGVNAFKIVKSLASLFIISRLYLYSDSRKALLASFVPSQPLQDRVT